MVHVFSFLSTCNFKLVANFYVEMNRPILLLLMLMFGCAFIYVFLAFNLQQYLRAQNYESYICTFYKDTEKVLDLEDFSLHVQCIQTVLML